MSSEIWKDVPSYEGIYEVSNYGQVRSVTRVRNGTHGPCTVRGRILSLPTCSDYMNVSLCFEGIKRTMHVHRMVAEAFIPNPHNKPQVNHKDGNKFNNNVDNLEWNTCQENMDHAKSHNLLTALKGEDHMGSKLSDEQIEEIRRRYVRGCKHNSGKALAAEFGVSSANISYIVNNKRWTHLLDQILSEETK